MKLAEELKKRHSELAPRFNPAILQRPTTLFQVRFEDGEDFHLVVEPDRFEFTPGVIQSPTLTLYLDHHQTFWDLLNGKTDSMAAFMEGRYRADGNIVLSQLLLYLFAHNNPVLAYEVQD
ncbi:MAG: SCP2 sterol-binding domain-containing protein [Pseudomonadales bacterium]|nr:SCP2 sterol-binding domain-containing protein [Pseudomonadales bacterium]